MPDTGPMSDAGERLDASVQQDSGAAADAGSEALDAAPPEDAAAADGGLAVDDAGPSTDAEPFDAATEDAGTDASTPDAGVDAGAPPAAPVDAAVEVSDGGCLADPVRGAPYVTCATCALDSAGYFWCWGRWGSTASGQTVRYFGSGFVNIGGTCAARADGTVACAEIVAGTMEDVPGLLLDRIAKGSGYYDDTSFGRGRHVCGWRGTEVRCFHEYSGTSGGTGVPPMAGTITTSSCLGGACVDYSVSGPADAGVTAPYDGFDAIGTCRSQFAMPTQCRYGMSGAYTLTRAPGTSHDVGHALDCAIDGARLGCHSRADSFRTHDLPGFVDYAITRVPAHDNAPGICAAYVDPSRGDHIRCFTDNDTTVRFADVNW